MLQEWSYRITYKHTIMENLTITLTNLLFYNLDHTALTN